jgi:hypothetical protein
MKLIDVATMQARVNSILLAFEPIDVAAVCNKLKNSALADVHEQCLALSHGLDFYAETNPQTIAPHVKKRRKKTTRRRKTKTSRPMNNDEALGEFLAFTAPKATLAKTSTDPRDDSSP